MAVKTKRGASVTLVELRATVARAEALRDARHPELALRRWTTQARRELLARCLAPSFQAPSAGTHGR